MKSTNELVNELDKLTKSVSSHEHNNGVDAVALRTIRDEAHKAAVLANDLLTRLQGEAFNV